jgi:hypothetical protein
MLITRTPTLLLLPLVALSVAASPETQPTTAPALPTTAPATEPAFPPAVALLIGSLSGPDQKQRRHAQEQLIQIGEPARPALMQLARQSTDLDAATRAQAALAQIDENRVSGPSFVTLHVHNAEARSVITDLFHQAFATPRVFPDDLWDEGVMPRVTIDADHQPFWTVMQSISDQTGLFLQPYAEGMRLMRNGMRSGISTVVGPFLISATQITRMQSIQLGRNPNQQSEFSIQMMVWPEPKLVVIQGGGTMEIEEAVDDNGNSLVMAAAGQRRMFIGGGPGFFQMFARLNWPAHPGTRIVRLVGKTNFTVQTRSQKFQIDNVLTAKEQTQVLGGATIRFDGAHKIGEMYEVALSTSNAPLFQQMFRGNIELQDEQGNTLEHRGSSAQGNGSEMTFRMQFAPIRQSDGGATESPQRLTWEVPVETKTIAVPFHFENLPMPR